MRRMLLLVLDSVGIGAAPDADDFGDAGSDTIGGILRAVPGLQLPNLCKLGLKNIQGTSFYDPIQKVEGCYGKCIEQSNGKDTTVGHWEIAGIISQKPFPTYPNGFPRDIIDAFSERIGRGVLGNTVVSGTKIIQELGQKHVETGDVIVYTSADSVFQIAAHEGVVPLDELYDICKKARILMHGEHAVSRIIARPFIGQSPDFERTANRRDFSLEPPDDTMLDLLKGSGHDVVAIGKIEDIFDGRGITRSIHTHGNAEGLALTLSEVKKQYRGLIFVNLVDFDMLYGHRNDPVGYAEALKEVDNFLPKLFSSMQEEDILIITADHGCDPTHKGTDHTREYTPLLVWGKQLQKGIDLGTRSTFSDIARTVLDYFNIKNDLPGHSFLSDTISWQ